MGCNVRWDEFPEEIAATATACNLVSTRTVAREELLVMWLREFDARLSALDRVIDEATARSATLGRRVRVELADRAYEADAVALSDSGHLLVRTDDGALASVAAADVVHLRPRS
jgi:BirA family biotin operon repressor/biotin-[acetyl-CoA-carboxylase] ligase